MRRLEYTVTNEYDSKALQFIFTDKMHLSGYLIRRNKHIADAVLVNGTHADVKTIVHIGDHVSVLISDFENNSNVIPAYGNLKIVYEDEDLLAVNKDAGQVVHPDHGHAKNSLGNFVMYHYMQNNESASFHPVQRLDNGTSGLIIIAKNSYVQDFLSKALHTDRFKRTYLAICEGVIKEDSGIINAPIYRPDNASIKRIVDEHGKNALTEYHVMKRFNDSTLVKLVLRTGRTHQIRVHMSYLGFPLVGDKLYGGEFTDYILRPGLHSFEAEFIHPVINEFINIKAPLPEDMCSQLISYGFTDFDEILAK